MSQHNNSLVMLKVLLYPGRVTMATESSKNSPMTMSRMNFSGYVGRATIFS